VESVPAGGPCSLHGWPVARVLPPAAVLARTIRAARTRISAERIRPAATRLVLDTHGAVAVTISALSIPARGFTPTRLRARRVAGLLVPQVLTYADGQNPVDIPSSAAQNRFNRRLVL
jgi:hypothetical protein